MPSRMTTSPKIDQCCAMSTTVSPVTQTADTAVNRLSASGVIWPVCEEMGRASNAVKSRMRTVKTMIAKRDGDDLAK